MTQPSVPAFFEFEGAETVDTNTRTPPPSEGPHDPTIDAIRYHQGLGGNGVKVTYVLEDGSLRGHYISLKKDPRYAINYGVRDVKILIGAINGWGEADERTKAIDNAMIQRYMGPDQPGAGKRVHLDVSRGKADPKRPGEFYVNVRVSPAAGVAPAPVTAPAVQAPVPAGPPAGWFEFPAGDPRHGKAYYNAAGETRSAA